MKSLSGHWKSSQGIKMNHRFVTIHNMNSNNLIKYNSDLMKKISNLP